MTTMSTMPLSGDWTVDDLDRLPDDGLRYELVDGVLLVSPSPLARHQVAQPALLVQLANAAPAHLRVLAAPLDITFSRTRLLQPDLMVLHEDQLRGRKVEGIPLLTAGRCPLMTADRALAAYDLPVLLVRPPDGGVRPG